MMYAYIDGDDIGLKIEKSFMDNNEIELSSINNTVKVIVERINEKLVEQGYELIFGGADGIICKKDSIDTKEIISLVRTISSYLTFSIGVGNSLKDSYIALRYAKCNGKNIAAIYDDKFLLIK